MEEFIKKSTLSSIEDNEGIDENSKRPLNISSKPSMGEMTSKTGSKKIKKIYMNEGGAASSYMNSRDVSSNLSHNTIPVMMRGEKLSPMMRRNSTNKCSPLKSRSVYRTYFKSSLLQSKRTEDFFGRSMMSSKNYNPPSFTFGSKIKNSLQIINKGDMNKVRGQDSPGVGSYNYYNHTLSNSVKKSRGFSKVTEKRFLEERLRKKNFEGSPHSVLPEQFPLVRNTKRKTGRNSIDTKIKINDKSINQDLNYSNLIYDGFTQGKQCKFTMARRFDIKDTNANPFFVLNNDSPGPGHSQLFWKKPGGKRSSNIQKSKVNIKDLLKRLTVQN